MWYNQYKSIHFVGHFGKIPGVATILAAILEKTLSSVQGHLANRLELIYIDYITFLIVWNDLLTQNPDILFKKIAIIVQFVAILWYGRHFGKIPVVGAILDAILKWFILIMSHSYILKWFNNSKNWYCLKKIRDYSTVCFMVWPLFWRPSWKKKHIPVVGAILDAILNWFILIILHSWLSETQNLILFLKNRDYNTNL